MEGATREKLRVAGMATFPPTEGPITPRVRSARQVQQYLESHEVDVRYLDLDVTPLGE